MTLIVTGALLVSGLMFALWLVQRRTGNAAIVDAGWAGGLALLGILYAWRGEGYGPRALLIGTMAAIWGFRLALFLLFTRIIGHPEEGRYQELRRRWRANLQWKFLAFFQFQAITCVVLSAPFYFAAVNPAGKLHWLEWLGAAVWALALTGEWMADRQLHAFKANPNNRGRTCQAGLWRYSRHPNYFFEWLIWVGFALFASGSPQGYWGWVSPALILYFVLRVTGIPATEEQAIRSRGEEYRRYQQTTSAFVPWFPKNAHPAQDGA